MSLKKILAQMVTNSIADDVPQKRILNGGLKVGIKVKDGELYLQLTRWRVSPSDAEWKTVVSALGGPGESQPRSRFADRGEYFLAGRWVLPTPLVETT